MDDRRRVVNADLQIGRDLFIENFRIAADLGAMQTLNAIATRGDRVVLTRARFSLSDGKPEEFGLDLLHVIEIGANERITATVTFDPDDIDAAFEELDARYLAGEAAAHAHTWSFIARTDAGFNRGELPTTTDDCVIVDHRHVTTIAADDQIAGVRAWWELAPDLSTYIEAVHRLSDIGAVFTWTGHGTSQEGFEAEWRGISILTAEGNLINRSEMFDEADIDAALAKFDEVSRPTRRLENSASRVFDRLNGYFATRNWAAMPETITDDMVDDDRRRVVNAGIRHGRDAVIANMRTSADLGARTISSTVIATRGDRLALCRLCFSGRDDRPEAFQAEALGIFDIDANNRITTAIQFDTDDIDAAFEELDARYLVGEAAAHAHTWSVIAGAYAALNRRELPATAPDCVTMDHRRGIGFAPGDMAAYIDATLDDVPDFSIHIETVHRLNNLRAVITFTSSGTSRAGFDAEWRMIHVLTVDGDLIIGAEAFDEADLDAALARFDELNRRAPQLENAASQLADRCQAHLAAGDWDAMAEMLADDFSSEDRRLVVGGGIRLGRLAHIATTREIANLSFTQEKSTVLATRGERLVLRRARYSRKDHGPDAFVVEFLGVVETNADGRIAALVVFDPDDIDAAFEELDARYVAGEAAPYSRTWSTIAGVFVAHNRREVAAATPDAASIDHRRVAAFAPGEGEAYIRAGWDLDQSLNIYIATVHRVSELGAVFTWTGHGTSHQGFAADWRGVNLIMVDGEKISRAEVFDEEDVDAAIARFEYLSLPAPRLENTASRMYKRFNTYLAVRDWDAMSEMVTDDVCDDDRRRVVSAGIRRGRDAQIANLRAVVDVGVKNFESIVIATRGERVALTRSRVSGGGQPAEPFALEMLTVIEIDTDNRIAAGVLFETDDIDGAFEELDTRYLAGEAADYLHTWSVIMDVYAAITRREAAATTPDLVYIDHRQLSTIETGGGVARSMLALWELMPNLTHHVETVHRLSGLGAVVTRIANGTTQEGFDAEWRSTDVITLDGHLVNRYELFDEADLGAALARFEELSRPA
jgi:hypothetical protein